MSDTKRFIDVAAGLIITPDHKLLLAQRPGDKLWSGWWELPGGKIETGETPKQALIRELNEELGINVTQATPWVTYTHEYPKTIVRLAFYRVTAWEGEPSGIEGQAIAWTPINGPLSVSPVLPATEPPLRWLQLPDRYLLTSIGNAAQIDPFLQTLATALKAGVRLVQFREPAWAAQTAGQDQAVLYTAFQRVLALCRQHGAYCLVNSVHPESWAEQADGIHYRAADAAALAATLAKATNHDTATNEAPLQDDTTQNANSGQNNSAPVLPGAQGHRYVGMSAHTADDLKLAQQIQADFAVLGHVLDTPSHPGVPAMGWDQFRTLSQHAGTPVFAIGGQSAATVQDAINAGAHGIAGIRLIERY